MIERSPDPYNAEPEPGALIEFEAFASPIAYDEGASATRWFPASQ